MATTEGLDPAFAQKLDALIAASGGRIYINSGYRSVELQTKLWNEALAKYGSEQAARQWVAPPGKSNHNHGIAADLGGDLELAHRLAPQFGLYFPMSWEAWHIEPIGSRTSGNRDAYTTHPGEPNPVDKDWTYDPDYMAGVLYSALGDGSDLLSSADVNLGPESAGASAGAAATSADAPAGGDVTPQQVYDALIAAGVDPQGAVALTRIAGRESGYRLGAHNPNRATGDNSYGLFQVNLLAHDRWGPEELMTLEGSARAAATLYRESGLHPWGPYKGMDPLANTPAFSPAGV